MQNRVAGKELVDFWDTQQKLRILAEKIYFIKFVRMMENILEI